MSSIYMATQLTYNYKAVGSQSTFGGGIGTTAIKQLDPIDQKRSSKGFPPNYDFLAYDGSIMASGHEFEVAGTYDPDKKYITYNEGSLSITRTDITNN